VRISFLNPQMLVPKELSNRTASEIALETFFGFSLKHRFAKPHRRSQGMRAWAPVT
jgi:hypothetical protein